MVDVIARSKGRAVQAMERFVRVMNHVPDDKLTWSPTPTAKSALQIAAHCAAFSGGFAEILKKGSFPADVEEFLAPIRTRLRAIENREQAEAMLRKGIEDTLAALDTVTPERIETTLDTPIGPTPFRFFMTIPADHLLNHIGQIDYLQTCWDDQDVHL